MFGLTTAHDTVLCWDPAHRCVTHRAPASIDPENLVLCTDLDRPEFGILDEGVWHPLDIGIKGWPRATSPARLHAIVKDGVAAFRSSVGFVGAPPDGTITMGGGEPHAWEWLGVIEHSALAGVLDMCRSDWLRVGTGNFVGRSTIRLQNRTSLRVGEHAYPIAGNFPLSSSRPGRHRNLLIRDGWMVDQFVRFRPLVYFVLMGTGAYAEQFRLATSSLVEFGRYAGDILVITDQERGLIETLLPPALIERLSVLRVASSGKIDAVLARLMLAEHPGAEDYAPILYTDADVAFDRPLQPVLEAALLSGKMSAQSERWNELPGSDAAGGNLFTNDMIPFRDPIGFNAGVWIMPGGADSVHIVETIRLALSRYLEINGRESLPWLDQAMGNYVLRKIDMFDRTLLTDTTRLYQSYEPRDVVSPAGFVHFWPVSASAAERARAMVDYLDRLREVGKGKGLAP